MCPKCRQPLHPIWSSPRRVAFWYCETCRVWQSRESGSVPEILSPLEGGTDATVFRHLTGKIFSTTTFHHPPRTRSLGTPFMIYRNGQQLLAGIERPPGCRIGYWVWTPASRQPSMVLEKNNRYLKYAGVTFVETLLDRPEWIVITPHPNLGSLWHLLADDPKLRSQLTVLVVTEGYINYIKQLPSTTRKKFFYLTDQVTPSRLAQAAQCDSRLIVTPLPPRAYYPQLTQWLLQKVQDHLAERWYWVNVAATLIAGVPEESRWEYRQSLGLSAVVLDEKLLQYGIPAGLPKKQSPLESYLRPRLHLRTLFYDPKTRQRYYYWESDHPNLTGCEASRNMTDDWFYRTFGEQAFIDEKWKHRRWLSLLYRLDHPPRIVLSRQKPYSIDRNLKALWLNRHLLLSGQTWQSLSVPITCRSHPLDRLTVGPTVPDDYAWLTGSRVLIGLLTVLQAVMLPAICSRSSSRLRQHLKQTRFVLLGEWDGIEDVLTACGLVQYQPRIRWCSFTTKDQPATILVTKDDVAAWTRHVLDGAPILTHHDRLGWNTTVGQRLSRLLADTWVYCFRDREFLRRQLRRFFRPPEQRHKVTYKNWIYKWLQYLYWEGRLNRQRCDAAQQLLREWRMCESAVFRLSCFLVNAFHRGDIGLAHERWVDRMKQRPCLCFNSHKQITFPESLRRWLKTVFGRAWQPETFLQRQPAFIREDEWITALIYLQGRGRRWNLPEVSLQHLPIEIVQCLQIDRKPVNGIFSQIRPPMDLP